MAEKQTLSNIRALIAKGDLKNKQLLLKSRPTGEPTEDNFELTDAPIEQPAEGQLLLKVLYISVDPYMRGRMNETTGSYVDGFQLGKPISGFLIAQVVESKAGVYKVGALVTGVLPYAEFITVPATHVQPVPEVLQKGAFPLSYGIGVLGMPGATSWIGFVHICNPKAGETVVVSGAAGAVGSVVGQIAKIKGCRVVGIVGKKEKARYITETLGFDAAINYNETQNLSQAIKEACPKGVDIYFDNVGGKTLEAVMEHINTYARISICGGISQYNNSGMMELVKPVTWTLLVKSAKMEGFIFSHYLHLAPTAIKEISGWLAEKKIIADETVVEGINNVPKAFIGLFKGDNTGKMVVHIADEATNE